MIFCFHHAIARSPRSESSVSFAAAGLISPPACQFGRPGAPSRLLARASGCLCFIQLRPAATMKRPEKITIGQMRQSGVTGVLIYCADHHYSHVVAVSAEEWPDDVRLSDIEGRYVCSACGHRGADIRPDWGSKK